MSDEQEAKQEETPAAEAPEAPAAEAEEVTVESADVGDKEMEEGKTFAILSYVLNFVGLPFFLVPLIMRNNEFSLYHAKQCLMLWLAGFVLSSVSGVLMAVCIGFILLPASCIFILVLNIMGLINTTKGEMKPVPLIGKWGDDWFKGIKKV